MTENKLRVSIQGQINFNQQQIRQIEEERAKATEKFDTNIATHRAIVNFLKSQLSHSTITISPSIIEDNSQAQSQNQKRRYTKPGVIGDSITKVLGGNSQGMTTQEICNAIAKEGLFVKYGAVASNIKILIRDNLVVQLSRPEIKRGVKYGLTKQNT